MRLLRDPVKLLTDLVKLLQDLEKILRDLVKRSRDPVFIMFYAWPYSSFVNMSYFVEHFCWLIICHNLCQPTVDMSNSNIKSSQIPYILDMCKTKCCVTWSYSLTYSTWGHNKQRQITKVNSTKSYLLNKAADQKMTFKMKASKFNITI